MPYRPSSHILYRCGVCDAIYRRRRRHLHEHAPRGSITMGANVARMMAEAFRAMAFAREEVERLSRTSTDRVN